MDRRRVRPTVEQVAERAGVSKATVSNALNGTGRLSPETRRRVIAAAHELSYVPYTSAFAQARGGTGMLGLTMAIFGDLAVPYTQNPYYSELILGAIGAAHARGYLLTVLPATMSAWSWLTTPVDGVVHCEPRLSDPVRPILERRGIPLVYAGRPPEPRADDFWVDTDDGQGLVGLLDHLRHGGARTAVAAVLPDHDDAYPAILRETYLAWCRAVGQEPIYTTFAPDNHRGAERAAISTLLGRPTPPDAVVGVYTYSGLFLLEAARAHGLAVPADLAIGCFSDDPKNAHLDPPVTTVSMRPADIGAESTDLLIDLIHQRKRIRRQRLLPTLLHVRASSAG